MRIAVQLELLATVLNSGTPAVAVAGAAKPSMSGPIAEITVESMFSAESQVLCSIALLLCMEASSLVAFATVFRVPILAYYTHE